MPTLKFDQDTYLSMICDDHDEYHLVEERFVETWRWGNLNEYIVKRESDGTLWRAFIRVGGDEMFSENADYDATFEQVEVQTKTIEVTEYVKV